MRHPLLTPRRMLARVPDVLRRGWAHPTTPTTLVVLREQEDVFERLPVPSDLHQERLNGKLLTCPSSPLCVAHPRALCLATAPLLRTAKTKPPQQTSRRMCGPALRNRVLEIERTAIPTHVGLRRSVPFPVAIAQSLRHPLAPNASHHRRATPGNDKVIISMLLDLSHLQHVEPKASNVAVKPKGCTRALQVRPRVGVHVAEESGRGSLRKAAMSSCGSKTGTSETSSSALRRFHTRTGHSIVSKFR